jgi:molybdenum cofactor biosynthesis protein B
MTEGDDGVRIAAVTVSDTRSSANDESGDRLCGRLRAVGARVTLRTIVMDEPSALRALIDQICARGIADGIITTGGTGIATRDTTVETIEGLLEKRLDGFGEAFRRLSWEQVGPRSILSRAVAGVYRGHLLVALPGNPNAVTLAIDMVLAPVLDHAVALLSGDTHH